MQWHLVYIVSHVELREKRLQAHTIFTKSVSRVYLRYLTSSFRFAKNDRGTGKGLFSHPAKQNNHAFERGYDALKPPSPYPEADPAKRKHRLLGKIYEYKDMSVSFNHSKVYSETKIPFPNSSIRNIPSGESFISNKTEPTSWKQEVS